MASILFIAAHRPHRSPSQRYRFEQYFSYLEANGFTYELSYIIDEKDDITFYSPGHFLKKIGIVIKAILHRISDVRKAKQFDIVFLQREAFMAGPPVFERLLAKSRAKLVFDFDDSIWMLDTSNANKKWEWLKSTTKTKETIANADLIFAGNQYLAAYAKKANENVIVVPTTIDTNIHKRKTAYKEAKQVCIGWSGSITTIKHFKAAVPLLTKIKNAFGDKVCFKVMGDSNYTNKELGINGIAWSNDTEIDTLSSFDIGIMPLPNNEWVKGKCGLKGLSYMALEVPTIMSAVGVNTSIINDGENGYLANTDEEWFVKLSALINSFELRKKLGAAGRKTVVEHYSQQSQKDIYLSNLKNLLTP